MIPAYHAGYVVDASVGVKWFVREREADREVAQALRQRHIEGATRMIVPELFLLEVPNAIKTGRKSTEEELAEVLTTLADLDIQVEQHTQRVLRKTNAVAWAYKLTWYDAVYVALAETLGFPCVTADEALLRKMQGHSIVLRLKDLAFE
ncbi:MAG: type II toxin-antitoxin system VapC family toxin [Nitrospira sp.]|nr:type II toxin-antitoxin system VapC family toxin [Nitrospira sp.]